MLEILYPNSIPAFAESSIQTSFRAFSLNHQSRKVISYCGRNSPLYSINFNGEELNMKTLGGGNEGWVGGLGGYGGARGGIKGESVVGM